MNPLVKICGTTSPHDAQIAQSAGADFLGVILHPDSPRFTSREAVGRIRRAVPKTPLVLVTVNFSPAQNAEWATAYAPRAMQLHGDETPELVAALVDEGVPVWKVISGAKLREQAREFTSAGAEAVVVDAREVTESGIVYGGTGRCADWNAARALVDEGFRVVLAGGLSAENVVCAIEIVRPFAVDVASGVEARPGVKDANQVRAFVDAARARSGD